jgi:hypothetical protein
MASQISDLTPSFLAGCVAGATAYAIHLVSPGANLPNLAVQVIAGMAAWAILAASLRHRVFAEAWEEALLFFRR